MTPRHGKEASDDELRINLEPAEWDKGTDRAGVRRRGRRESLTRAPAPLPAVPAARRGPDAERLPLLAGGALRRRGRRAAAPPRAGVRRPAAAPGAPRGERGPLRLRRTGALRPRTGAGGAPAGPGAGRLAL